MFSRTLSSILAGVVAWIGVACDRLPGKPAPRVDPPSLDTSVGFAGFYASRCAGCHGAGGTHGPARPLCDGEYLASIPEDALFQIVRNGIAGTRMPGFGGSTVTGVSDEHIRAFIIGMKRSWMNPPGLKSVVPWGGGSSDASIERGATLFESRCAFCHPSAGGQALLAVSPQGGDVRDPFYVRLVSDQHLRTSIIFGRRDLGMPAAIDPYQGAGGERVAEALTTEDVDALVAYLATFRQASTLSPPGNGPTR